MVVLKNVFLLCADIFASSILTRRYMAEHQSKQWVTYYFGVKDLTSGMLLCNSLKLFVKLIQVLMSDY